MIEIKETSLQDLKNVQKLWADGEVMKYVGFPEGLCQSDEEMNEWYKWISSNRPRLNHYCIFEDGMYLGETFYEIDQNHENSASLDIKLFSFARGKGIATKALKFAIDEAFKNGATKVWVDPNKENLKAISLYNRLGFIKKEMPAYLINPEYAPYTIYMELERK